jgi:hypothetical protein
MCQKLYRISPPLSQPPFRASSKPLINRTIKPGIWVYKPTILPARTDAIPPIILRNIKIANQAVAEPYTSFEIRNGQVGSDFDVFAFVVAVGEVSVADVRVGDGTVGALACGDGCGGEGEGG